MGDTTYKRCADCGKRIRVGPRSKHTKYCADCVERRDLDNRRRQKDKLIEARHQVGHRTRACSQCGAEFVRPAGRAGGAVTRCDTCRATPVSRRTLPDVRPCEGCGAPMTMKPNAPRRFCQTCRVERAREQDRQAKARKRPKAARILTCQSCGKEFQKNPMGRNPRACPQCRSADYESRRPPRSVTAQQRYAWSLVRQYGMTPEQRDAMAERQGHKCALCGRPESPDRRLHVDHDHACCPSPGMSCGKCVRGLICRPCNNALGLLGDNVEAAQRMVAYLRTGGVPKSPNRARLRG